MLAFFHFNEIKTHLSEGGYNISENIYKRIKIDENFNY